jgi:hypothetical protein
VARIVTMAMLKLARPCPCAPLVRSYRARAARGRNRQHRRRRPQPPTPQAEAATANTAGGGRFACATSFPHLFPASLLNASSRLSSRPCWQTQEWM